MLHRAGFRIAVLPIFAPNRHRRARAFFGKEQRCFGGAVAATDNEHFLSDIRIRINESMMDLRQVFAGAIQVTRILHRAHREQNGAGLVSILVVTRAKAAAVCAHGEALVKIAAYIDYFFARADFEIVVENKMNVVRE